MKPPMDAIAPSRTARKVSIGSLPAVRGTGAACPWIPDAMDCDAGVLERGVWSEGVLAALPFATAAGATSVLDKKPMVELRS
jgi:hypothetical protein